MAQFICFLWFIKDSVFYHWTKITLINECYSHLCLQGSKNSLKSFWRLQMPIFDPSCNKCRFCVSFLISDKRKRVWYYRKANLENRNISNPFWQFSQNMVPCKNERKRRNCGGFLGRNLHLNFFHSFLHFLNFPLFVWKRNKIVSCLHKNRTSGFVYIMLQS